MERSHRSHGCEGRGGGGCWISFSQASACGSLAHATCCVVEVGGVAGRALGGGVGVAWRALGGGVGALGRAQAKTSRKPKSREKKDRKARREGRVCKETKEGEREASCFCEVVGVKVLRRFMVSF